MRPLIKGLLIAAVQVGLVASLGAKLLYDRSTLPRVWALAAPYDPNLPIRGRYVRLYLAVEPRGLKEPGTKAERQSKQPVILRAEGERLVAEAYFQDRNYNSTGLHVQFTWRGDDQQVILTEPLAFFIPEHVPDPSRRPRGEELWVEVTIPPKGPPRPIRLGVKKGDGPIIPLPLQ